MRPQNLVAIASCVAGASLPALAQPFTFERIGTSQTSLPGGGGTFSGYPSFDGVATSAREVVAIGPTQGLYKFGSGSGTVLADRNTLVPGLSVKFDMFMFPSQSGAAAAFLGGNSATRVGIYRASPGLVQPVAVPGEAAPDGGTLKGFATPPSMNGPTVAFRASKVTGELALYRSDSGTLSSVANTSTPVPGGTGTFTTLQSDVRVNSGSVYFSGADSANKYGIYRQGAFGLQPVITPNTFGPAGQGRFLWAEQPAPDGDDLAFFGRTEFGPAQGAIYTRVNGVIQQVAAIGAPMPDGSTFSVLQTLTFERGSVVFQDNSTTNVFTNYGGTLVPVLSTFGGAIDGKGVRQINFSPAGRDGDRLALSVVFNSSQPFAPDDAVYLVTLPAPGPLACLIGAGLFVARRRRGGAVEHARPSHAAA